MSRLPFSAHGTVNPTDPCVLNFVTDWLAAFGAQSMNTSCLASIPAPDFSGTGAAALFTAQQQFGAGSSLWNSPGSVAPRPAPTPAAANGNRPSSSEDAHDWSPGATAGLAVATAVVGAALGAGFTRFAANRQRGAANKHEEATGIQLKTADGTYEPPGF